MTPEDRDVLRAEASMRILAAMYTNVLLPPAPRDESDEARKARELREHTRRTRDALEAVQVANALVAELGLHEEAPAGVDTVASLVAAGIAAGGTTLACKHGVPSYEACAECDAADAAGKSGQPGTGKEGESGTVASGGNF